MIGVFKVLVSVIAADMTGNQLVLAIDAAMTATRTLKTRIIPKNCWPGAKKPAIRKYSCGF